jgi:isoquinoline 1-oxidoreductase alpha subunit
MEIAVKLKVNGKFHEIEAEPDTPLLWALRDIIGLTGTKFGCGVALCGACTVHVDNQPRRSCVLPISAVGDANILTVEGLSASPVGKAVQDAWLQIEVVQCGYCQTGQIMQAAALLAANPAPDDDAIDRAMSGNICRCGTYPRIRAAIHAAAKQGGA